MFGEHSPEVSVPLRGYGFEMLGIWLCEVTPVVSVPLRGYGFEMGKFVTKDMPFAVFPSPCGDMVLKYDLEAWFVPLDKSFRPLAGIWF